MIDRAAPVVQMAGLTKIFRDFWRRPRVEAVSDLNLEIHPGEVFGLLGPNGSGKTTTIKMMLGLLYPTRGRLSIFGRPPTDVNVKSRIGFLPEDSYLYRFLVAHETLDFFGRLFRLPPRVRKERTDRLLDMVGLRHEAKRPVGEYSKGMARRIGLAQALINDPEFLILDEPTSGLDPVGARQIKDVIRSLGNKGKTILLSSHVLADVEDVCDRVTILYGGQQRAAGDIAELLRKEDTTQITTAGLAPETVERIRDLIYRLEKKDIQVSSGRMKLEDFFLRIVNEAQAANIRTSGARAGGEIPEFLRKATERSMTEEVLESLVHAAAVPIKLSEPVQSESSKIENERKKAARQLIADLTAERFKQTENAESVSVPVSTSPFPATSPETKPSDRPKAGDQSIIDRLVTPTSSKPSNDQGDAENTGGAKNIGHPENRGNSGKSGGSSQSSDT